MVNFEQFRLKARKLRRRKYQPIDFAISFFTVATPIFEIPQAVVIYSNHDARNVSLFTWGFLLVSNLVWLTYALRRRVWPLIVSSVLYLAIELLIVVGIILYS